MSFEIIEEFGRIFVPERVRPSLKNYLWKAGINEEPYMAFGISFLVGLLVSMFGHVLFVYNFFIPYKEILSATEYMLLLGIGSFLSVTIIMFSTMGLIMVMIYFFLDLKIYNRTKKLEDILPDFLETVASNLRGGLSFEKSLWMSINPRFGILANEITIVAKKVMTGHDVDTALTEFGHKYDSPMLRRAIELIAGQLAGGGNVADIIDDIVEDLKKTKELKEEIRISVLSYIIFITAVVVVISPVLFALAYNLITVLQNIMGMLTESLSHSQGNLPFSFSKVSLDPEDFKNFSRIALGIIAVFASLIVSIVEKGSIKGGVKYIPIYLISSQLCYYIFFLLFSSVFSTMMNF